MDTCIAITGARGRVACAILPGLKKRFKKIYPLSRTASSGYEDLLAFIESDCIYKLNCFLHFAWSTVPFTSENQFGSEWCQDLPFLTRILQKMSRLASEVRPHLVFMSSAGTVYGDASHQSVDETCVLKPIGMYGRAKARAEEIIQFYGKTYDIPYTILRVSNLYGFRNREQCQQGVLPILLAAARNGHPFTIWGDGSGKKDYLHIEDFQRVLEHIITAEIGGIYNISFGESYSLIDLIALVENTGGGKIVTRSTNNYSWDTSNVRIDNSKIRERTGWVPQIGLEKGVEMTIRDIGHFKDCNQTATAVSRQ